MDKATYDRGLQIRKNVLGNEFVDKAIASADDFNRAGVDAFRNAREVFAELDKKQSGA
jgi:hypothetical protein